MCRFLHGLVDAGQRHVQSGEEVQFWQVKAFQMNRTPWQSTNRPLPVQPVFQEAETENGHKSPGGQRRIPNRKVNNLKFLWRFRE